MTGLTPRRSNTPVPDPSESERHAAAELLRNIEEMAPESQNVTPPEVALPELVQALEERARTSED
ncbi:MAG TPA: hypothetical protein VK030_01720 [Actinomycetales bacterium]|nr:hypothetical protein [Actinomycetales bacterium]